MNAGDKALVRLAQAVDFAEWKVLWDGYNAFYGRKDETALPDPITNMTWSRFFDGYEPMHALVAERAGHLVGLAHFLFHRSTITIGPTCYLRDLYTAESARGQGVGRDLIEGVCRYAKAAGAHKVYWQTHETNTTARQLYDKVATQTGFVVYERILNGDK